MKHWHGNYWQNNYWNADYWQSNIDISAPTRTLTAQNPTVQSGAQPITVSPNAPELSLTVLRPIVVSAEEQDYWKDEYWNFDYWSQHYWSVNNVAPPSPQEINTNVGQLNLSTLPPNIVTGLFVFPGTPVRTLTKLDTTVSNEVIVTPAAPSLTLTPFPANIDNAGYQVGDINWGINVASTFGFTAAINITAPSRTLTALSAGIEEGGGTVVNVQQTPLKQLTAFPALAANNVLVQTTVPSRSLTGFDVLTGLGISIPTTTPQRTLTPRLPAVTGSSALPVTVNPNAPQKTLLKPAHTVVNWVPQLGYTIQVQAEDLTITVEAEDLTIQVPSERITQAA